MLFALFIAIVGCPVISALATSQNEMPTHLISVDYSSYPDMNNNNNNNKPIDDASAQESIKIENRQLYDTVKHASVYDPDERNNSSRQGNEEQNEKINSSSVKIFIPPRKSAVIQAIPRKVRGPGSISTSTTSLPFARPPNLHATTAKDYGTGEPTTTIVYATSIPTPASRTYVNIRPVPLLPTQKYRSTIVAENKQEKMQETSSKPVMENYSEEQQQEQKSQVNVVLEKPAFKIETNSEQSTTTPRSYETTPYHVEQRKRNLYKSVPYAKIRTNEEIDEMPTYNRNNAFVNSYPNHKWTDEDYMQRMPPTIPPQFVYENHKNPHQSYYQPSPIYPHHDDYQEEMYRPSPVYVPQQQPISALLSQQQHPQGQQYQPLTVRDFDLLLQLLVLRERRLHASQEPSQYPSSREYSSDPNYYYDMPKMQQAPDSPYYKNIREPKFLENSMPRNGQPSNTRLLPSNVREELLFRMLLLALHLQPQPKPVPRISPPMLPSQYMYFGPPVSAPQSPSSSAAAAFLGFRQRNGIPKNPVRSVQVLGEID